MVQEWPLARRSDSPWVRFEVYPLATADQQTLTGVRLGGSKPTYVPLELKPYYQTLTLVVKQFSNSS